MAQQASLKGLPKDIVLDANISIRGVFGIQVRKLLDTYAGSVAFFSPDVCFRDARRYIPALAEHRNFDPRDGLLILDHLTQIVETVDRSLYEGYERVACSRISQRDVCMDRGSGLLRLWDCSMDKQQH
jgi:hypothetical protein